MFKMKRDDAYINIFDLIHEYLPEERRHELAESLSCSDIVIKNVMDQVMDGFTEQGMFHGAESTSNNPGSFTPLQKARRRIAEESSEVAKKEIERLQRMLDREERYKNEWMNKYFDIYHAKYNPILPR